RRTKVILDESYGRPVLNFAHPRYGGSRPAIPLGKRGHTIGFVARGDTPGCNESQLVQRIATHRPNPLSRLLTCVARAVTPPRGLCNEMAKTARKVLRVKQGRGKSSHRHTPSLAGSRLGNGIAALHSLHPPQPACIAPQCMQCMQ